ncbi:MAG: hypothetical protein H0X27_06215 [Caulobacteraceae bacterium]|nr:hypothetical protein [Caulobacteraceae bacterium]
MGIVDRLFDAMRSTIEMRGDIDRNAIQFRSAADTLLDHEKRLVRLETLDEFRLAQRSSRPPRLSGPRDE